MKHQDTKFKSTRVYSKKTNVLLCIIKACRKLKGLKCLSLVSCLAATGIAAVVLWKLWGVRHWDLRSSTPKDGQDDAWDVGKNQAMAPLRPTRPTCIRPTPNFTPNPRRYCSWNATTSSLQHCYEMLKPHLEKTTAWVFLGNSGMATIPYLLSLKWPFEGTPNITTRRNSCQNLVYYGLPPPLDGWKEPNPVEKGEGPIGRGKEHPYCMDCTNCWNVMMKSKTHERQFVEYLVVEYSRDVTLPSLVTPTTQETIMYYLTRRSRPAVCVASTGIEDAAILPPMSDQLYLENAGRYLAMLQRYCENVIWLGLHPVVENAKIPQTNCRLQYWTTAFVAMISERNYDNVYLLDIWEKSFLSDYSSPTRLGQKFYESLARVFSSLMVP